ncbi:MogA/MoaB family molybdenum cofactor biosynthesis protein [Anoxybacillus sp. FSL W8-0382]|jgi:molybdenum cofactor biosynthesis protein B|uniref:Molybdenum cofactor biosynthesis protein B n=2 Tax=Anoxybacillaceae TaxID=3120669 RepID=A0A178TE92_9BACL|nr:MULTISPECIES: MogA/MoaB family molybdenum cofactor biosynthesis protein [Bacillaceae]QAV27110.1 molybdenum cofactor biosynthesis protein [Neobacillus thermocopriae]ASA95571.1 molybdenum cofactor biosynthesis protein [Anoxybacillus flavithermus]MBE2906057.1 MogA/MoaB family molybdenum cofactor biosynthesis protein [Anoxybacillus flavithermus]OAO78481.1 Molybdenum cofactor biosynthesis protein MoaB [Anoxybacillus flavithermus]OAO79710.1 Molybdenum cofactor biosynthesis protein MoaB [Anoxybaci
MGVIDHKSKATCPVRCKVVTVSDTRTKETDQSGALIIDLLKREQMNVVDYEIVKDDREAIQAAIQSAGAEVDVILMNGGTGFTKRDVTVEAVQELLEKEMVGFGELFRFLSYEEIGSASMLSRAIAGTIERKIVFCMPGSTNAVRLAMEKLILPELRHLVWELQRQ